MALYKIAARRINDRPDANGWHSSGTDMPTFWVEAVSAENAAAIGHTLAGHATTEYGTAGLSRTLVQAYRETEDGGEEWADTTQWWAEDGRIVDPTRVNRQYGHNGRHITGDLYAEQDADEVTWFTHDAGVWLHLTRSPRGKWAIDTSDHVHILTRKANLSS
jgi:hypothetical protein